ncbi:hypothetical protein SCOR_08210 [Sulfidibacter corallicola]
MKWRRYHIIDFKYKKTFFFNTRYLPNLSVKSSLSVSVSFLESQSVILLPKPRR